MIQFDMKQKLSVLSQLLFERKIYAEKISGTLPWSPVTAEGDYEVDGIVFSSRRGLGSVPSNANVWWEGLVAFVRPSVFLQLALDDEGAQDETSRTLEELVKEGYALGIPFLEVAFDEEGKELPRIKGHEGRARMKLIRRLIGDKPVPVHLLLRGGIRSRDVTPEMIDELKIGVFAERSNKVIRRPFEQLWLNGREV